MDFVLEAAKDFNCSLPAGLNVTEMSPCDQAIYGPNGLAYNFSSTCNAALVGNSGLAATLFILIAVVLAFIFACASAWSTMQIPIATYGMEGSDTSSVNNTSAFLAGEDGEVDTSVNKKVLEISTAIQRGSKAFLYAEYAYMAVFIVLYALLVFFAVGASSTDLHSSDKPSWLQGLFTSLAFVLGGVTSIASGFIGMTIAVQANSRTALQAQRGYAPAFKTAFQAASVMGFALCGLALVVLFVAIAFFRAVYYTETESKEYVAALFEAIAGYGLGGSSIALFGRVGGGIYTKAADVGADLVGKVEQGIPEDDPRNPAVIADNVGDNVGDIAGMGADLFGSFAESSCAALVVAGNSGTYDLYSNWNALLLPLVISASGIIACMLTSFLASHLTKVRTSQQIEPTLKMQLFVSTFLETGMLAAVCWTFMPPYFCLAGSNHAPFRNWGVFVCAASGLWAGLIIGLVTEYFTSHSYKPVRDVATACKTGAATNIIYGLALGYKSAIIPVIALAVAIWTSYVLAHLYGVACAALGILSTLSIGLTIDAYGPISDNAGGIAEMAGLGDNVRERTDALDAAGNTTAAIGKGFAIGSAAFVSLALFGAFVTRVKKAPGHEDFTVDILQPFQFAGLLLGSMLPYWFSALTMKSVGEAALAMVEEVRRQFREIPGIMEGTGQPDYERCVAISTRASLREMIAPGVLVMGSPFIVGFLFGVECLAGLLAGGLVSGVQMAVSSSNTGGAWDNAKKYIEAGAHGGKGSEPHKAAVVGDTVGDPLKDTSGPSLNILMKLMAVESLVFSTFFIHFSIPALADWKINNL